ncbi:MAG: hypothetical protein CEO22_120 [Candidatus Berkelbacteria bacterium Gr01-1014_85]|uniref:Uncharacterized protein n=1 Tax=Candidatus Berkelbacteria bacterium Gr01-1014_85 TaxID=2017150 RepID=A0A554JDN5_9BACT|nr:MAG: hypothetical protein CEO22_120 [Candidatus Berkelbacteria bacterium Gr01-1014_85]
MAEEQGNMWPEPESIRGAIEGVVNPEYDTLKSDQQHVDLDSRSAGEVGLDEQIDGGYLRRSLMRDPDEGPDYRGINDKAVITKGGRPDKIPDFEPEERYQEAPKSPAARAAKQLKSSLRNLFIPENEEIENSKNVINQLIKQVDSLSELALSLTEKEQYKQGEVLGRREFHGLHHIVETWGNVMALRDRLERLGTPLDTADVAYALLALAYHDVDQTVIKIDGVPKSDDELRNFTEQLRGTKSLTELTALQAAMKQRPEDPGLMSRGRAVGAVETASAQALIANLEQEFLPARANEGERELIRQTLTSAIMATQPGFMREYIVYQPNLTQSAIEAGSKPEGMTAENFAAHQRFAERVRGLVAFADLATSAMQPELAMQQCVALRIEDSLFFNQLVNLSLADRDGQAELSATQILSNWQSQPELGEAVRQQLVTWLQQQDGFLEGQRRQINGESVTVPVPGKAGETETLSAPTYSLDRLLANLSVADTEPERLESVTAELKADLTARLEKLQETYRELRQKLSSNDDWQEELARRLVAALEPTQPLT